MSMSDETFAQIFSKLNSLTMQEPDPRDEDFNPNDWYGGNADDCYDGGFTTGYEQGQYDTASEILNLMLSAPKSVDPV